MILSDDIFVRFVPFPPRVRGLVEPNDDGTFSVYINSNLSYFMQQETYEHELRHIVLDHLYVEKDIEDIEAEAKGRTVTEEPKPQKKRKKKQAHMIRCYGSLKELEEYLESIHALDKPIEDLGRPLW